jgi:hypothetical protein
VCSVADDLLVKGYTNPDGKWYFNKPMALA